MPALALRRLATLAVAGPLLVGTSGCVSLMRSTARSYQVAPNGLSQSDDAFRRALTAGNFADAYERSGKVKQGAPQDVLLRALYRGTAAFHAGDYPAAALAFAEADRLAEERETRSLSRHAASLVTSDQVLSYLPSRTERLFTRYYAMMSYLRADSLEPATVEARRLGLILQATSDSIGDRERAVHAMLREAAGAVFESAGETNDALVSYRNAALLRGASPQAIDSIAIAPAHPDSATLVVFVEAGFVAHRVNQELSVPLYTFDAKSNTKSHAANERHPRGPFTSHVALDTGATTKSKEADAEVDAVATVTALVGALDQSDNGLFIGDDHNWRRRRSLDFDNTFGGPIISLSWPALVRTAMPRGAVQLHVTSPLVEGASLNADSALAADSPASTTPESTGVSTPALSSATADISDAIAADLRRALPAMLTRLVVRSAAKAKAADMVGDEYGWWAGTIAGIAGDLLERADTRSWQLLPGQLSVVRLRVPIGELSPRVTIGGAFDAISLRLPSRRVAAGDVVVINARIFRAQSSLIP